MRLRVRPLGDAYVGPSENSEQVDYASQFVVDRRKSLGWISVLPDELILAIINQLPVADLARLSGASLAAHAFANSGNGWKEAVLDAYEKEVGENADSSFPLGDTWRARFQAHVASDGSRHPRKRPRLASRQVVLYSDVLAHLERCARGGVPEEWLSYSNIPRCHGLTAAEFQRDALSAGSSGVAVAGVSALRPSDDRLLHRRRAAVPVRLPFWGEGARAGTSLHAAPLFGHTGFVCVARRATSPGLSVAHRRTASQRQHIPSRPQRHQRLECGDLRPQEMGTAATGGASPAGRACDGGCRRVAARAGTGNGVRVVREPLRRDVRAAAGIASD
eukprot:ctg_165.g71